jgi:hypothetical protein
MKKLIGQFQLGDMMAAYVADDQRVGLLLTPSAKSGDLFGDGKM